MKLPGGPKDVSCYFTHCVCSNIGRTAKPIRAHPYWSLVVCHTPSSTHHIDLVDFVVNVPENSNDYLLVVRRERDSLDILGRPACVLCPQAFLGGAADKLNVLTHNDNKLAVVRQARTQVVTLSVKLVRGCLSVATRHRGSAIKLMMRMPG